MTSTRDGPPSRLEIMGGDFGLMVGFVGWVILVFLILLLNDGESLPSRFRRSLAGTTSLSSSTISTLPAGGFLFFFFFGIRLRDSRS